MIAMQYSFTLPADYDMALVERRKALASQSAPGASCPGSGKTCSEDIHHRPFGLNIFDLTYTNIIANTCLVRNSTRWLLGISRGGPPAARARADGRGPGAGHAGMRACWAYWLARSYRDYV